MRTTANTFRGAVAGLVASWVKALSEPPLQAAAEWILPPSPAQKQEVRADPRASSRPSNTARSLRRPSDMTSPQRNVRPHPKRLGHVSQTEDATRRPPRTRWRPGGACGRSASWRAVAVSVGSGPW